MPGRLTRDEEVSLARRIGAGDKSAEDELVTRNLRLVGKLAKQFVDQGLDLCDLIQEGSIGLIRAARTFDPERKTRFSTYAGLLIHQHLCKAVHRIRPMRLLSEHEAMTLPARVDQVDEGEGLARNVFEAVETLLDEDERLVLELKFGGPREKSHARISIETGRSRATVGRTKRKALAKLRRSLNPTPDAA